jgi:hypothetical protein
MSHPKQNQLEYIRYRLMNYLNEYDQKFVVTILWRIRKDMPLSERQNNYLELIIDRVRLAQSLNES